MTSLQGPKRKFRVSSIYTYLPLPFATQCIESSRLHTSGRLFTQTIELWETLPDELITLLKTLLKPVNYIQTFGLEVIDLTISHNAP